MLVSDDLALLPELAFVAKCVLCWAETADRLEPDAADLMIPDRGPLALIVSPAHLEAGVLGWPAGRVFRIPTSEGIELWLRSLDAAP